MLCPATTLVYDDPHTNYLQLHALNIDIVLQIGRDLKNFLISLHNNYTRRTECSIVVFRNRIYFNTLCREKHVSAKT